MPTAPTYDTPQVAPQGLPNASIQGLGPRQLLQGEISGEQTQRAGQSLETMGVQDADFAAKQQMLANQSRVDLATNAVLQAKNDLTYGTQQDPNGGYTAQKGMSAVQPDATGQGLAENYSQKLQSVIDQQAAGLGNDLQRQVFLNQIGRVQAQFQGEVQQHVAKENMQLNIGTQQSLVQNSLDAAKTNWQDYGTQGGVFDTALQNAKQHAYMLSQLQGADPVTANRMVASASNLMFVHAAGAAIDNGRSDVAQQILKDHPEIDPDSALKLQGLIHQDQVSHAAMGAVQTVLGNHQSAFQPTDLGRLTNIVQGIESGGSPNAVGPYVPGQGTAKGSMQVMDATAKNPGLGVKAAQDDSPEERARVGRDYVAALAQRYGGDPAKVLAAYNAGFGNVDKAIAEAGPGGDWMAALANHQSPANHQQTVNYVQKGTSQFQAGLGAPAKPTIEQLQSEVLAKLGPNPDPDTVKAATTALKQQFTVQQESQKQQAEQTVQQTMQKLVANGGDWSALTPSDRAAVFRDAPDKVPELQRYAGNISNPVQKDNMAAWHTIQENPAKAFSIPDSEWNALVQNNFTDATQKQLTKQRSDFMSGKIDTSPQTVNDPVFNRLLNNRLQSIGLLDANGKPADRDQVGTINKYLHDGILARQQQTGQKMTEAQLGQYLDHEFVQNYQFHNTIAGIPTYAGNMPYLGMKPSDIPDSDKQQITDSLAKRGNYNPSNDMIMRLYWRKKGI